jgi:hypothetical protein
MNLRRPRFSFAFAIGFLAGVTANGQAQAPQYPTCAGERVVWVNTNSGFSSFTCRK